MIDEEPVELQYFFMACFLVKEDFSFLTISDKKPVAKFVIKWTDLPIDERLKAKSKRVIPFGGDVPDIGFSLSEWQKAYRINGSYKTANEL